MNSIDINVFNKEIFSKNNNVVKRVLPYSIEALLAPSTADSLPTSSLSTPRLICEICGGQCSGKKGHPVCKGCREFFRRAVRNNRSYRCSFIGKCKIDVQQIKNQCRSCRLRQCLEAGMDAQTLQVNTQRKINISKGSLDKRVVLPDLVHPVPIDNFDKEEKHSERNECIKNLNIKDVTKSFLKDVLRWPKNNNFIGDLSEEDKKFLLNSQWTKLMIVTICENDAYLLDLPISISTVAHRFHHLGVSKEESFYMKAIILFMISSSDGTFPHQSKMNDHMIGLCSKTNLVDPSPARFGELMELLGTICHLPLDGIRNLFQSEVLKILPQCI